MESNKHKNLLQNRDEAGIFTNDFNESGFLGRQDRLVRHYVPKLCKGGFGALQGLLICGYLGGNFFNEILYHELRLFD